MAKKLGAGLAAWKKAHPKAAASNTKKVLKRAAIKKSKAK